MKYQIRHQTLSSTIKTVEDAIQSRGYNIPDSFTNIGYFSHIEYGTTHRFNEELQATGKRNNGIAFQIYRDDRGMYELNMYFWR